MPWQIKYVITCLMDRSAKKIAVRAYQKIIDVWNAEAAAIRMIELSKGLLEGENVEKLFENGPCSAAPIIQDR